MKKTYDLSKANISLRSHQLVGHEFDSILNSDWIVFETYADEKFSLRTIPNMINKKFIKSKSPDSMTDGWNAEWKKINRGIIAYFLRQQGRLIIDWENTNSIERRILLYNLLAINNYSYVYMYHSNIQ